MARITIHLGTRERLEPRISKATPLGALPTEAGGEIADPLAVGRGVSRAACGMAAEVAVRNVVRDEHRRCT